MVIGVRCLHPWLQLSSGRVILQRPDPVDSVTRYDMLKESETLNNSGFLVNVCVNLGSRELTETRRTFSSGGDSSTPPNQRHLLLPF